MPIRDLLLTATVLSTLPVCLLRPWIGVLVWSWLAYMNPHRLTWEFAHDLQFSQFVAFATVVGFIFTSDRKPVLLTRETLTLGALWAWFALTSLFAMYPDAAWSKFLEFSKILVMLFLAIPLFQDRRKLRLLLFVIAISLAFYGVKGGLFVLANGGQYIVFGPPGSFFASNNELGLALNMSLPLIVGLAREEGRAWPRRLLWAAFFLTMLAVPFTYSRGAVLGLMAVLAMLFLKARRRMLVVAVAVVGMVAFTAFAPTRFVERMETLQTPEADESAQLRLMSWRVGYEIAADRPVFGGGFKVFTHRATYDIYLPEYPRSFGHDAHSIYFNLLGEHGWIGLSLFIVLIGFSFQTLRELRKMGSARSELAWAANYGDMLRASIVTYLVTGAFLSAAYFDLAYHLLMVVVLLKKVASDQEATLSLPASPLSVVATPRLRVRPH
jgi:probable O-glycosylation ligase (exosortase A-associated)